MLIQHCMRTISLIVDNTIGSYVCSTQLHSYYHSGSADPYFGIPGKDWPADRHGWKVNPTLLKAETTEYLAGVTESPYASYIPMQK